MPRSEELLDPPHEIDPYKTLEVSKTATDAEIRLAYKKLALKKHPDKVAPAERDAAHQAFQDLAFAYAVLSDTTRRARYDRTGRTDEAVVDADGFDWTDFYRAQFAEVITTAKIDELKAEYQGSAEETRDVLAAYTASKGNLDRLFEQVLLSEVLADEARFCRIIDDAIAKGKVEPFKKYTEESAAAKDRRRKRAEREAREAEKELARRAAGGGSGSSDEDEDEDENEDEKSHDEDDESEDRDNSKAKRKSSTAANGRSKSKPKAEPKPKNKPKTKTKTGGTADLAALIQQRQAGRAEAFFDNLEAKYGGSSKGGKGKKRAPPDEPPEEAFAAMAERKRGKK